LASNLAQPKQGSRSKYGAGTFKGKNSTKHHSKCFKPNAHAHISKLKENIRVKKEKASHETKVQRYFLFDFLTRTLN
jgi:hypothetical protein